MSKCGLTELLAWLSTGLVWFPYNHPEVVSVLVWLHTQDVHATFELQGLFDDELRLLGDVSQQAIRSGGIEFLLNNHLYLLCDCLDLSSRRKRY